MVPLTHATTRAQSFSTFGSSLTLPHALQSFRTLRSPRPAPTRAQSYRPLATSTHAPSALRRSALLVHLTHAPKRARRSQYAWFPSLTLPHALSLSALLPHSWGLNRSNPWFTSLAGSVVHHPWLPHSRSHTRSVVQHPWFTSLTLPLALSRSAPLVHLTHAPTRAQSFSPLGSPHSRSHTRSVVPHPWFTSLTLPRR